MRDKPIILVQLIHIQGPLKGQIQEVTDENISIGRHPTCHVQFPKDLSIVSRKHAEIVREGNRFKLIDKSTNGTYVNGKKIEEAYLKDGDVLMFSDGGPKVSFLTKVLEDQPEAKTVDTAPAEKPAAHGPVSATPPQGMDQTPAAPVAEPPQTPVVTPPQEQPQARPAQVSIEKVQKPLIVQYGPTLNSYRELPVTIGSAPGNDMVLAHPAISDRHAQIFFSQNQYWIKDLTGENIVSLNSVPISLQAPLNPNDILALSSQGPRFTFLGEGRLAEIEEPAKEQPRPMPEKKGNTPESASDGEGKPKGIGALYKDIFKR
jgi:pSer/pThr/pTyr-binding forkhead associated (FHA) protein